MARSVTLKSIAQVANVSVSAASKALADDPQISDATKQRIRRISRELNYRPVRRRSRAELSDTSGRTARVGLVLVDQPQDVFFSHEVLDPLSRESRSLSIALEIVNVSLTDDDPALGIRSIIDELDGLLLYGQVDHDLFDSCTAMEKPCVLMGQLHGDPIQPSPRGHLVSVDVTAMGQMATRYLINAGHKRIAFICASAPEGLWFDRWLAGYRYAHTDADSMVDPHLVLIGTPKPHVAFWAAEQLTKLEDPPTAYVIPDPHTASIFIEFMRYLEHPVTPGSLVCGATSGQTQSFDVSSLARLAIDSQAIATTSLQLLRREFDGHSVPPSRTLIPFQSFGFVAEKSDPSA